MLVQASGPEEAVAKVVASLSKYDYDCRVGYRNSFGDADEEDTLIWAHQTWSREDADGYGVHVGRSQWAAKA